VQLQRSEVKSPNFAQQSGLLFEMSPIQGKRACS
jgi:hypothetical protein